MNEIRAHCPLITLLLFSRQKVHYREFTVTHAVELAGIDKYMTTLYV